MFLLQEVTYVHLSTSLRIFAVLTAPIVESVHKDCLNPNQYSTTMHAYAIFSWASAHGRLQFSGKTWGVGAYASYQALTREQLCDNSLPANTPWVC